MGPPSEDGEGYAACVLLQHLLPLLSRKGLIFPAEMTALFAAARAQIVGRARRERHIEVRP